MDRGLIDGTHSLEGNGCIPSFYHYVWKRRHNTVSTEHELKVPSTVVYSDGFPKEWYVVNKQGEIDRRIGKDINTKEMLRDMCTHGDKLISEDGCVVAWYVFKVPQVDGAHKPGVQYFDRKGLDHFLFGKTVRPDGFLQKFIPPDGKHNVVIQAIWSPNPAAQLVGKRENFYCFYDRRRTMVERVATFEGPIHYSREAFVAPHVQWQVKRLCQDFVDHFKNTEHAPIQRMVLYFKLDRDCELWFLWCSSIRIFSSGTANPLNLCVEYVGHETTKRNASPQGINLIEGSFPTELSGVTAEQEAAYEDSGVRVPPASYHPRPPSLGAIGTAFSRTATCKEKRAARLRVHEKLLAGKYALRGAGGGGGGGTSTGAGGDGGPAAAATASAATATATALPASPKEGVGVASDDAAFSESLHRTSREDTAAAAALSHRGVKADEAASWRSKAKIQDSRADNARTTFMGYRNVHKRVTGTGRNQTEVLFLDDGDGKAAAAAAAGEGSEWACVLRAPLKKPGAAYMWTLVRIALHTGLMREMCLAGDFAEWARLSGSVEALRQHSSASGARTEVFMPRRLFTAVGQPLMSYLAMFQVTVRRVEVAPDPSISHLNAVLHPPRTASNAPHVALQLGKQQSTGVLWSKIKQFSASFFKSRAAAASEGYKRYKQKALEQELARLGWLGRGDSDGGGGRSARVSTLPEIEF